jgi:AraC-like DNA-binding protein
MRRVADSQLAELPPESALFSDRVRALVARELATPRLSTSWVARKMRMSARTLARRLEQENTTFFALLDEARRVRALRLMEDRALNLTEIAMVLGFAHVASFHRAFRRWTGRTPAEYRHGLGERPSMSLGL